MHHCFLGQSRQASAKRRLGPSGWEPPAERARVPLLWGRGSPWVYSCVSPSRCFFRYHRENTTCPSGMECEKCEVPGTEQVLSARVTSYTGPHRLALRGRLGGTCIADHGPF